MTQNDPGAQPNPAQPTQVNPSGGGATEFIPSAGWPQGAPQQPNPYGGQPQSGQHSGPYAGYTGPVPQQPAYGGYPVAPARPSALAALPKAAWLAIASGLAGIVTYFMGIAPWVVINEDTPQRGFDWAEDNIGDCDSEAAFEAGECAFEVGVPAFTSPSLILSPGFFFIVLGVGALTSLAVALPKLRRYTPVAALFTAVGLLAMLAAFMGTPVLEMGAGAITGLIFGVLQLLLIGAAVVLDALSKDDAPTADTR